MIVKEKQLRKLSTRLIRKGALIEDTYAAFQHWDLDRSTKENLQTIRDTNSIGASNAAWLKEIIVTLSSRFTQEVNFEPLVMLAEKGLYLEAWKPCLLWHIGSIDTLYYEFATEWLFEEYKAGTYLMRTEGVVPFVRKITDGRIASGKNLTEYGVTRAGRDMLRMASDFGLLSGSTVREFVPYHLSEESFLYVLHAIAEHESNATRIVQVLDWRLFLMYPEDVERELLRLHQFRKLDYQVAGSLAQLKLPFDSLKAFAQAWTP